MTKLNRKYRFTAIFLLTVLISHPTFFHFKMEEKVLCVHNEGYSHIENIYESHISDNYIADSEIIYGIAKSDCADYKLDKHIDKNVVKVFNKLSFQIKKLIVINFDHIKKVKHTPFVNRENIIPHNAGLESLASVSLLI